MAKMFVVLKREYLERVRSKWFIIVTILGPVLLGVIMILPIALAMKTKTSGRLSDVVIIDATATDLGTSVAKSLTSMSPSARAPRVRKVTAEQIPPEEERATSEVMRQEALGYLVLDASTLAGKEMRYAGRNATALIDVENIERAVRQSLLSQRLEREGVDASRISALTNIRLETRTEKITDRGKEGASGMASFFFGYGVALVLYMMIAIYGQSIMRGVLEEKTTRVAEVVVSSVKPDTLLAGKIIGSGMVALTQMTAWLVVTYLIYLARGPILEKLGAPAMAGGAMRVPSVEPLVGVALVLFFVLGFIFYAALFGAVGAMVSNQEDVQQAATPVMILLISSIVFMQPILLNPSSTLAVTMSVLPFSAPLMMPLRMALIAVPWYEIVGALLSVAVGCWIAIWLSARIYRVGLLMYGKRPSLRELARWIRMA
ncbi:MAG: ABC transporter permease [Gemmatimonadaceae bacterium]